MSAFDGGQSNFGVSHINRAIGHWGKARGVADGIMMSN